MSEYHRYFSFGTTCAPRRPRCVTSLIQYDDYTQFNGLVCKVLSGETSGGSYPSEQREVSAPFSTKADALRLFGPIIDA